MQRFLAEIIMITLPLTLSLQLISTTQRKRRTRTENGNYSLLKSTDWLVTIMLMDLLDLLPGHLSSNTCILSQEEVTIIIIIAKLVNCARRVV